ncbi:universal stress protein [Reinekea blandensis]|uniref:Universal stress protein UspA and related nucleotide-binding protein n=1 Tax=Reinekea blandensis MED297 TaxID=314283 RepID=A4BH23_9GAMM|nr:universal stress protein [Reinekea blandensis]EAR08522.1 Universal stress protein UspA and related nucleotide-binding protein [Reinekea sp. MED297] [Reinekea blandensis MED297]
MAEQENNNNNQRVWTIACIDGSKYSSAVCDYSVWLSQVLASPFKALHAIEHTTGAAVADLTGAIGLGAQEHLLSELTELEQQRNRLEIQKGRQMLEAVKGRALEAGIEHPVTVQRHGTLVESLIELESEARVVVMGIRGEAHDDNDQSHIGTHLESLVRAVQRPIFVVNSEFSKPQTAMLAYDGSSCCRKALEMVKTSPLFEQIPVHVVHVAKEAEQGEALVAEAKAELEAANRQVQTKVLTGEPSEMLCRYQQDQDIDLTVMGAFSHNRLREMVFGSFTVKMLSNTQKPLLLLR